MRAFLRLISAGALLLTLLACGRADRLDADASPSPSNSFYLSQQELATTIDRANKGDIEAMDALYYFYSVNQEEDAKGRYWLERAAVAGDMAARKDIVCIYAAHKDDPNMRARAKDLGDRYGVPSDCPL